jgi:capsid protein
MAEHGDLTNRLTREPFAGPGQPAAGFDASARPRDRDHAHASVGASDDTRGVSWLATALDKPNSLDTYYDDAELERKKGTAMFRGFYRRPIDADDGSVPNNKATSQDDIALQSLGPNIPSNSLPGTKLRSRSRQMSARTTARS